MEPPATTLALEVHIDSLAVLKCINSGSMGSVAGWALCKHIRLLLEEDWVVRLAHIYWEANACTNHLVVSGGPKHPREKRPHIAPPSLEGTNM